MPTWPLFRLCFNSLAHAIPVSLQNDVIGAGMQAVQAFICELEKSSECLFCSGKFITVDYIFQQTFLEKEGTVNIICNGMCLRNAFDYRGRRSKHFNLLDI